MNCAVESGSIIIDTLMVPRQFEESPGFRKAVRTIILFVGRYRLYAKLYNHFAVYSHSKYTQLFISETVS